jgi:anthranilate phosphoribosyltransferase
MLDEFIKKIVSYKNLSENEAYDCMMQIICGIESEIQISSFLTALSMKGETVEEITGFVRAMREVSVKVSPQIDSPLVDTCGTGGDYLKTFNVSTISAIIAASCGITIAKHGNRNITSKCGGADILEALGVNITCNANNVERCIEDVGIGFIFAPNFHTAMKNVMPIRQEIGIRTVFNILGPLTSPARADIQLLGVFDPGYVEVVAEVLKRLGLKRAMVVHGYDDEGNPAMDEISTIGKTKVAFLNNGKIKVMELYPEDFGIEKSSKELIRSSSDLEKNVEIALNVLKGKISSKEDMARLDLCLVNSGAILFLAGIVNDLSDGVQESFKAVKSGRSIEKLYEFIKISNDTNMALLSPPQ